MAIVIGLDIGTSGIRAQAIELGSQNVLSTAITLRHPLPGSNVIDHLDFVSLLNQFSNSAQGDVLLGFRIIEFPVGISFS